MTPEEQQRQADAFAMGARASRWAAIRSSLEFWVMLFPIIVGVLVFVLVLGVFVYLLA